MPNYTSILTGVTISTSIFSLLGELFVIFTFLKAPELRTCFFRMVLWLQVSDAIMNVSSLINFENGPDGDIEPLCIPQAFLINFAQEASILWTILIAQYIYSTIVHNAGEQRRIFQYGITIIIPLILSIYPLFLNIYGPEQVSCWIKQEGNLLYRFLNFFLILWIALGLNFIFCIATFRFVKGVFHDNQEQMESFKRLLYFPLILIVCWSLTCVLQILETFEITVQWLNVLAKLFAGLQGGLNSIVYGLSPNVKQFIKETYLAKKNADSQQELSQMKRSKSEIIVSKSAQSQLESGGVKQSKRLSEIIRPTSEKEREMQNDKEKEKEMSETITQGTMDYDSSGDMYYQQMKTIHDSSRL